MGLSKKELGLGVLVGLATLAYFASQTYLNVLEIRKMKKEGV